MCGIVGVYQKNGANVTKQHLSPSNNMMVHRGPDSEGYYIDKNFGMGMRRLSIIGIDSGDQPLSDHSNNIHLVLNGEVYNYIELRQDLRTRGYTFKTESDAECLLYLYQEYGFDAIKHLNGMFGFALWDSKKKLLWVGRDRLGIKPLYYRDDDNNFMFSSTLDSFALGQDPEYDEEALLLYLGLSYIPAPKTIYKNVHKLEPAHWLTVCDRGVHLENYWDPLSSESINLSYDGIKEKSEQLLRDSIMLHKRSHVPVGTFLSGGMDSSTITALFAESYEQNIHTFCSDFEGKTIKDSLYAEQVAKSYKTIHHPLSLRPEEALKGLNDFVKYLDEPIADSAIVPTYLLSLEAKKRNIKVLLSGAGGDEIFGGYSRHYKRLKDYLIGKISFSPPDFLNNYSWIHSNKIYNRSFQICDPGLSFGMSTSGIIPGALKACFQSSQVFNKMCELVRAEFSSMAALEKELGFSLSRMYTDLKKYLPDNILALSDKATMAASIEGRFPFLDHRLVELAFVSNYHSYLDKSKPKIVLRDIASKLLPNSILDRPKTGFNGPVPQWISDPLFSEKWKGACKESHLFEKVLDVEKVEKLFVNSPSRMQLCETWFQIYIFSNWEKRSLNG